MSSPPKPEQEAPPPELTPDAKVRREILATLRAMTPAELQKAAELAAFLARQDRSSLGLVELHRVLAESPKKARKRD